MQIEESIASKLKKQYLQFISLTLEHASITTVNLERLINLKEQLPLGHAYGTYFQIQR